MVPIRLLILPMPGMRLLHRVGCLIGLLLRWRGIFCRAVDDLVQLAAVQPYPAAVGAIINFNALAVSHQQLHVLAYGAVHGSIHPFALVRVIA